MQLYLPEHGATDGVSTLIMYYNSGADASKSSTLVNGNFIPALAGPDLMAVQ